MALQWIFGILELATLGLFSLGGGYSVEISKNDLLSSENIRFQEVSDQKQNVEEKLNVSTSRHEEMLFDFTTVEDVDNWREISDTVRTVGKSKAVLSLQTTQIFQRAVFFTLLNPQQNGAGFAGVRTMINLDLSNFTNIEIICRAQGSNSHYKVVLRHKGLDSNEDLSYEQYFTVSTSTMEFSTVTLPLKNFKPYYRGREMPDADPLDRTNITMFGLQVYGGVYLPIKQKGVSALEIETITAS